MQNAPVQTEHRAIIVNKPIYFFLKRLTDIIVSFLALLLLIPLFLVVAVLIKLDSKGPVIFKQVRAGINGKPFVMYKFRTMVPDAEEQLAKYIDLDKLKEPVFKLQNDPRVTRLGKFLRKTSIDELPQLVNVLLGHMSLVGPRPEEKRLTDRYNDFQKQRLLIKPGITGWQQVCCRADESLEKRVKLDIEYINNQSFWFDIKILLLTVKVVLLGRGAR